MQGKRDGLTNLLWRGSSYPGKIEEASVYQPGNEARTSRRIYVTAGLGGAIVAAVVFKIALLSAGVFPFNADEAVVALMARHITMGARPLFFYGQAYMGSLDAILAALGFRLWGQQVWVIRLVQVILYASTLTTTALLGRAAFGSWKAGVIAAWLLAIPTVNMTLYTTVSLGGYGEMLLIGNLILLTALRIANKCKVVGPQISSGWMEIILGLLVGLGMWAFGLSLVYALPACFFVFYSIWRITRRYSSLIKPLGRITSGMLIGSLPILIFAFQYGFESLIAELNGAAIAGVENLSWFGQLGQHLFNLMFIGSTALFGLRPPWEVRWLALPLAPFVLFFWIGVIVYAFRNLRVGEPDRGISVLFLGVGLTLIAGFVFTPFGADPSGRYFLPLAVVLSLFAGGALAQLSSRMPRLSWSLLVGVLAFHLIGTVQAGTTLPPGLTTQFDAITRIDHRYDPALIEFLLEEGEHYGYTNYWVGYPLAFQSAETLIFIPRLPYHHDFRYTSRDDRYESYTRLVEDSDRVAYITTNHEPLNAYLREGFTSRGIAWQEHNIGDYHIFFNLSEPIRPVDIGLGITTP